MDGETQIRRRNLLTAISGLTATSALVAGVGSTAAKSTLARNPISDSLTDYEFRRIDPPSVPLQHQPSIRFEDEAVVVRGTLAVDSAYCEIATLSALSYDEDEAILTVEVGNSRLDDIDDGRTCSTDVTQEAYELTVTIEGNSPETVEISENSADRLREWSIDRDDDPQPSLSGIEDYEFILRSSTDGDPDTEPQVAFGTDTVRIAGDLLIGSSSCKTAELSGLAYDKDEDVLMTSVADAWNQYPATADDPLECTDDMAVVSYTLVVSFDDGAPAVVIASETDVHDDWRTTRMDHPASTQPETMGIDDYRFRTNVTNEIDADDDPRVWTTFDPDDVVVDGELWVDSSTCKTVRLSKLLYDEDDGTLEVELTDGWISPLTQAEGALVECDDEVGVESYLIQVTVNGDQLDTVTVVEDDYEDTRQVTVPYSEPRSPTNLDVLETTATTITLQWESGFVLTVDGYHYHVFLDGELEQESVDQRETTLGGLEPETSYEIGVATVDEGGTESSRETITVTTESRGPEPPAIHEDAPRDTTDDGMFNDITGSGSTTMTDVNVFFEHIDDPAVTEYPDYYDFNGDGKVSVWDLIELFESL
ncbi:fibronectin type III domain-containing protein [Halobacteria archaeon AArc-m2/3/4]|uniref:Fibronectin type III domain-containing protein n=1 Tax=Natronoglomus mannanivorans TaxID=2979990 RepID=A0AAP2YWH8_9EURY|nr:fibronectin type III domain-containing protein [Halobacteria archaeon AArc-xg1-1]MCU4972727.1 fibronectin type III domain-containing protein [Halobacteria archaeon AArc-m2/3/4]